MTKEEAMNAYEDEEMFVVMPQTYDIKNAISFFLIPFKSNKTAAYSKIRDEQERKFKPEFITAASIHKRR